MAVIATETPLLKVLKNSDILIGIGVVAVIVMMVIPIYTFLLNLLLAFNITFAIVIILTVMYIEKPIDFSVFPALLLVTTIFRLALNVSSTRLILLKGRAGVEGVITAFGDFVVGGNYVVGIVIFLILVIIQFMVIIKGATRVSEVAARFTLDAMPGKQMAIDADLNAGMITEEEAKQRRKDIRREADFYGAMDGASKFVQGDVVAGLIITVINVLGGFAIGVWMRGETLVEALQTYTLLTIGDGLAAQIPSLLISVATGIIVTRAASDDNLGAELSHQLSRFPRALYITAGTLAFLGIATPMPTVPFLGISIFLVLIGLGISKAQHREKIEAELKAKAKETTKPRQPENVVGLLQVDPMELEMGYSLIPLVDVEQGGDLLDRITLIRRQCAIDYGIIVPPIRIRDNMQLKPNSYVIKIKGTEIAGSEIYIDRFLAMNPGNIKEKLDGIKTVEPAFGLPAVWINADQREYAERLGFTVVDPSSIIATHLTEVIKSHAHELLDRQTTQKLIDNLKESHPSLIQDLIPEVMSAIDIQLVLQNLLREGISIRDLPTIFETLLNKGRTIKDPTILTEYVRMALARQICLQFRSVDETLSVITLTPKLEKELSDSLVDSQEGPYIALDPIKTQKLMINLSKVINDVVNKGLQPVILVAPNIRPYFKRLIERSAPNLIVMSYNEVVPTIEVKSVGMVSID